MTRWHARVRGRSLPPGPKRWPFIGNMLDVPMWKPWYGLRDLCERYGEIVYLELLGETMVILGSPGAIHDLLDKRASNTADRVETPLIPLAGHDFNLAVMQYGPRWRRHRRMLWQQFHPGKVDSYKPVQRDFTRKLLAGLLERPSKVKELLQYQIIGTMMKITYDIDLADEDDVRIGYADRAFSGLREVTAPVQFLLQHFPLVQYIPAWFPGAGFHRVLAEANPPCAWMLDVPFSQAKADVAEPYGPKEAGPIVAELLRRMETSLNGMEGDSESEEQVARNVAALIVEGGSDTTVSTLEGLILALSLFPEVQQKARAELDAIVGAHRLPDFDDRDALVYINAVVKEALRWHNVSPLSIAHVTVEDDEFHGYFIPAGTTVVPNVWACMHDPRIYPEPEKFCPERFIGKDGRLNPDVLDPATLIFGSGRRICPGRYFVDAALFLTAASVLQVFDIGPPKDENGCPIKVEYQASHGFLSYPEDTRCTITPRSAEAVALILGSQ
ncbi:cytochrome P450 [Trametes versicolor FP-101664 SS1]|uniref:cytochrome P450 n=1 Tax=Trametes versicolor (strain FP-101664) TaxID=717944 RepID=UPI000462290D|nr:cytochrome P450 [Trametes versicolor FP-101664 SS1]EIW59364.1 cytochrome P450 [Trametes versicolor FP-101664 SS1]